MANSSELPSQPARLPTILGDVSGEVRERKKTHVTVTIVEPPHHARQTLQRLPARIRGMQSRWQTIKEDLPPQLSRKHIGMISVGGVIGTGLFLGSGEALVNGGPIGALIGYSIIGSVVYCLCVSIGEMIAFLPNVGGVVGLADLYVDPALGFSMGWAAWYNWSITLPAEVSAAVLLLGYWIPKDILSDGTLYGLTGLFLSVAVIINLFPSRIYGEFEFWFSTLKVLTIVIIIIVSLALDFGIGTGKPIGFKLWEEPFAESYMGISGPKGQFLGFLAVLMQAGFSFFGSEVPGIAAGEVIDATRNVPRALGRVWVRITLFYIGGIICAGLLVHPTNPDLIQQTSTGAKSPFVIAFNSAGIPVLAHILNAAMLLSAWSAAASDIYISSRFLFFLAHCGHAPQFFKSLLRYPHLPPSESGENTNDGEDEADEEEIEDFYSCIDVSIHDISLVPDQPISLPDSSSTRAADEITVTRQELTYVLPLASVLASASLGLLAMLAGSNSADEAFTWLVSVASVASLQSWAAMLFIYIRWHHGTIYAEEKNKQLNEPSAELIEQLKIIQNHRHAGQPYLAWYAFIICLIILLVNGWDVFIHNDWQIAETDATPALCSTPSCRNTTPVSTFLASYVPLPFFLLLTFGYKLIYQTELVKFEEMTFSRENVPELIEKVDAPRNLWERIFAILV